MSNVSSSQGIAKGGSDSVQEVIKPSLHHVFLKTGRLDEMKEWYRVVLGMTPNFEWEAGAFMTNDDANHRIVLFSSPVVSDDPDKVEHAGLHHLAFEYDTCDDLFSTYERLKKLGIEPHASLDHGLTMSFYYLDPDGNSLELQYDNFGDWAGSTEFIRSDPAFAAEPIGQPVDPAALVAARGEGASMEEIHRRAYAGEMPPGEDFDIRIPG
jgi:catechol 2,3-dioxygenase